MKHLVFKWYERTFTVLSIEMNKGNKLPVYCLSIDPKPTV